MGEWELEVENIGGFSGKKVFKLISGLNWVFGENATGKSSLVNSLKVLNNLRQYYKNIGKPEDFRIFMHHGRANGSVVLQNSGKAFNTEYNEVFTSGGSSKLLEGKLKQVAISNDPAVLDFSFIDTSNPVMSAIEFNGNIQVLKDRIRDVSRIKDYFKIQDVAKGLFKKYKALREEKVKEYGYKIKEYNLMLEQRNGVINELEKEISNIQEKPQDDAQIKELKRLKDLKQNLLDEINKIKIKNIDALIGEIRETQLKLKKAQDSLKDAKREVERLRAYKDLEKNVRALQEEQSRLSKQRMALEKEIDESKSKISEKNGKIKLLTETLETGNMQCDHCLAKIDSKILNETISTLSNDLKLLQDEKKQLEHKKTELTTAIDEKNRKEIELQKVKPNQTEIEQKINKNQKEISTFEQKIKEKTQEKDQSESTMKTYQDRLGDLNEKIIKMSSINEEARATFLKKLAQIHTLKEERGKIESQKEGLIQKSVLVSDNLSKLVKKTEYAIDEIEAFIEKYYYDLIDETNKELDAMKSELNWGFKSIRINDELEIEVINQEGLKAEFATLSDFERKSISILILYIMKNTFFPDYPLFVIDEHMNSADEGRCSSFITLLHERENRKENHILVVTSNKHNLALENGRTAVEQESLQIFHVK